MWGVQAKVIAAEWDVHFRVSELLNVLRLLVLTPPHTNNKAFVCFCSLKMAFNGSYDAKDSVADRIGESSFRHLTEPSSTHSLEQTQTSTHACGSVVVTKLEREACQYPALYPSFSMVSEAKRPAVIEERQDITSTISQLVVTGNADAGLEPWILVESDSDGNQLTESAVEPPLENQTIYDGVVYEDGRIHEDNSPRISSMATQTHSAQSIPPGFVSSIWSKLSAKWTEISDKCKHISKAAVKADTTRQSTKL